MISTAFGRRGAGKTTLLKNRIRAEHRTAIFDMLSEYGDCGTAFNSTIDFAKFLQERGEAPFRAVLQPMKHADEAFELFLRACWIAANTYIFVDEIDMVSSPASVPDELFKALNVGRHRGLSLFAASRRPAQVPRIVTSQSEDIHVFNCREPRDIQYIAEFCGKDFALEAARLQQYEYLTFDVHNPDAPLTRRRETVYDGRGSAERRVNPGTDRPDPFGRSVPLDERSESSWEV